MAAATGCAHVCLFTFIPPAAAGHFPVVDAADVADLRARMDDHRVTAGNLEVFPLDGAEDRDAFARALDVGARLGATRATAHLHAVTDPEEAVARFAAFAGLAHSFGIIAGLEFMRFSAIPTIGEAARIVREAGAGALVCDALHLFREGGTIADVAANADLISYVQLADGPPTCPDDQRWSEAVRMRALAGTGAFPLEQLLGALHRPLLVEVEVPRADDRRAGVGDLDRARAAVAASREVITRASVRKNS
ncbi:MAG: TIM barrel protein [Sphingobium sp.]|uniref:sugar phosphate isomerase/epimerase family protein n=1 Tax=Sphingobium sp. TaxID=1912891 RepID=UPI003BAE5C04